MLWINSKKVKSRIASLLLCTFLLSILPATVLADAVEGETVVTLGENLSQDQKNQILTEMGVKADEVTVIYVSNEEEHQYLGQYISATQIGNRAFSSARIILTEPGSGIQVQTNNITWVTEEMYANALVTGGVTDADVYVTAPFKVSGTAGLTGTFKAFEVAADIKISEEQKQAANEEMVVTAELGEKIGTAEAAELLKKLKESLGDTKLETYEDYRNLVKRVAGELNIELSQEDIDALVHLLKRLQSLNIDWKQVGKQLTNIRQNLDNILDSDETRNIIRKFIDLLIGLVERAKTLFS